MSLKHKAISGMIWTYFQQFSGQFVSFLVSVVLARLILPEEFGLIGMLAVFIGLGTAVTEGGLTSSLIRMQHVDDEDYSTVFFYNFVCSIIIYIVLYIFAPLIGRFYHQPLLVSISRVYGLTFIISSFGAVQSTILTKQLKFKKQAIISIPALGISSVLGLFLAFRGFGVWTLIYSALANSIVTTIFLWWSSDWRPKLLFNIEKFKSHFFYGYKLTISSILDIIFTNIYQIVIGKYYSASMVGYYSRANTLMMLPVGNISGALNKVIFPLFSTMQDDIPKFRESYKKVMLMVLFLISPIIVIMATLAKPLVIVLFTERWLPIVPIFQIICLTGILYPIHLYNLLVLQVKGRSDLYLRLEIIKKLLQCVILAISFFYGFYSLLYGQLIFSLIALMINTHYAGRLLNYSMVNQIIDILPIFGFAFIMGVFIILLNQQIEDYSNILKLFIGSFGGLSIYLSLGLLFRFQSMNDIKNLIKKT